MRRVLSEVLLWVAMWVVFLWALCAPVWAMEIAPGVRFTPSLEPSSGSRSEQVKCGMLLENDNEDTAVMLISFPFKGGVTDGVMRTSIMTYTVLQESGEVQAMLTLPVPEYATHVPGSLTVDGEPRPDPFVVSGGFGQTVTVPAASDAGVPGTCLVEYRVDLLVPEPTEVSAISVPVSISLMTNDEGKWKAQIHLVTTSQSYRQRPRPFRWLQGWALPDPASNVVVQAHVPLGMSYRPTSAYAYTIEALRACKQIPGSYDPTSRIVRWELGDIGPGKWGYASWRAQATER